MKIRTIVKMLIILFLSFSLIIVINDSETEEVRSLFSWEDNEVLEGRTELLETMKNLNLNTLYQSFSREVKEDDIKSFLLDAKNKGIDVYYLDGDPEWALIGDGEPMIETIETVIGINSKLNENIRMKSIILDVEPYTLEEWEDDKEGVMNGFLRELKSAYKKANESKLELIVCIPYFYDNKGFSKQLEELIKSACDGIAIMNYMKDKEINNIEKEVEIADKYGKRIINIYELQAPGQHGLQEKNTYYNENIEAVEKNFKNMREEFYDKDISIAFHEYTALKEVLNRASSTKTGKEVFNLFGSIL